MRLCGMFILGLTFTCRKYFASKRGTPFITQAFWASRADATRTHKVHRGHPEQQVRSPRVSCFFDFSLSANLHPWEVLVCPPYSMHKLWSRPLFLGSLFGMGPAVQPDPTSTKTKKEELGS